MIVNCFYFYLILFRFFVEIFSFKKASFSEVHYREILVGISAGKGNLILNSSVSNIFPRFFAALDCANLKHFV